ncbi:hypothetical protein ACRRTK_022860 [Alexandromys fortis]
MLTVAVEANPVSPFLKKTTRKRSKFRLRQLHLLTEIFLERKEHLILAFFAGVLLTLLLMALIFFVIKSCRRSNSSTQAQDSLSEPPIKKLSSTSKESLTYASMTFKPSGESSNGLTGNGSTGLDPTVYSEIKVADPSLPLQ